jgi:serine/threonine protein kinase
VQVPSKIGRYRVTERLGSGAFATVWLAEDDVLESQVAIKVLAENWSHHPDVRARFEQEAQVLRRADGGSLADRLEQGPMAVRAALRTASDIAHAVTVLHESGVLHRDLKPSNVLFDTVRGSERVLVADLGLAKAIAHASGFTVVAGTPGYMAPEQSLPGGGLDVRADVHAIGAMTYQMLTGQAPQQHRAAPSKLRPEIPRQVDRVVMRALDADRNRRWPSPAAFASALESSVVQRRVVRFLRHVTGTLLALLLLALTAGATVPGGTPQGWVRVTDAGHTFSVSVPGEWARQLRDSGWNVSSLGLPPGTEPGLQVGTDLRDLTEPALFSGRSRRLVPGVPVTWPTHPGCTRQLDREVHAAGLTGEARRCTTATVSYTDVLLTGIGHEGVYMQIRQQVTTDHTDQVLKTLRLVRS